MPLGSLPQAAAHTNNGLSRPSCTCWCWYLSGIEFRSYGLNDCFSPDSDRIARYNQVGFVPIADVGHRDARKSRVRARYPRVATAGGSPSLNFTPTEKILMLAFEVPV